MPPELDETHDPTRVSWVESARGHPVFPLQNLPFGIFSLPGETPRGGVAIGDDILDLSAALAAGLLTGEAERAAEAAAGPTLNPWMALGPDARSALRKQLFELLSRGSSAEAHAVHLLHKAADCRLHVPAQIGDYTDFFAGIHHAYNGGVRNKRPTPLLPNYKYVPVAYHSRASSIVSSGERVPRPNGQRKLPDAKEPTFGPSLNLDFELEVGIWIGPGNQRGSAIPIEQAGEHVVGFCMLNDWSARDIQSWETQPLGPFLAKNFATTISPWVVTSEALAPFRQRQRARPAGDPRPLDYLWDERDQAAGAYDIVIEALIRTSEMRRKAMAPHLLSTSNVNHLYWTPAQMVAHHTCGGCRLRPGDLFGTGTISAPERSGWGSLAELSDGGQVELSLPTGESRTFIEDGDEIFLRARAERNGYATVGFGECVGQVVRNDDTSGARAGV